MIRYLFIRYFFMINVIFSAWSRDLTWILSGEHSTASEIAVVVIAAIGVVVSMHGKSCVSFQIVGFKAISTRLNGLAIHASAAASIVNVCLQGLIISVWFWHTKLLLLRCGGDQQIEEQDADKKDIGGACHRHYSYISFCSY